MTFPSVEPGAVLLLHGVGLDPRLFDPLLDMLSGPTLAPLRPPYADAGPPGSVSDQAVALAEVLATTTDVTVVGVSGGATIALALAALDPPGLAAVVAHEPLVGPLAPDLHATVAASAARLAASRGASGVAEFLARLVGPEAWAALPPDAIEFARIHADVVRAEVPTFATFAPDVDRLAGSRVPVLVTTGGRSHRRRHDAAAALAGAAPIRTDTVAEAGHLVHVDQPARFAALIDAHRSRSAP